jgi:hypothetical protein
VGRVAIDQAALRRKLNDPQGAFARDLMRKGNQVRNEALPLVPVDENRLRGDIHVELQQDERGNLAVWVGSRLRYAAAVHNGTRPHFPPVAALLGWVKRHGMPPGAAYAIARKIGEVGTEAHPFLTTALRRVFPNSDRS